MSLQLAEDIIKGRRLKRGEDLSFLLSEDLDVRELIKSERSSAATMWICVLSLMDEADAAARTASFARSQPVIMRRWKNIHFWSQRRFWRTASVMRRRRYIDTPS